MVTCVLHILLFAVYLCWSNHPWWLIRTKYTWLYPSSLNRSLLPLNVSVHFSTLYLSYLWLYPLKNRRTLSAQLSSICIKGLPTGQHPNWKHATKNQLNIYPCVMFFPQNGEEFDSWRQLHTITVHIYIFLIYHKYSLLHTFSLKDVSRITVPSNHMLPRFVERSVESYIIPNGVMPCGVRLERSAEIIDSLDYKIGTMV